MELIDLLRVVRRWFWLIVVIVVVTELALWLGTRSAEPVYATAVTLQISTPQREEVAAYDEYRSISLRDEITVAINNFVELLQSDEVRQRTISQLVLEDEDGHYKVAAVHVRDADFINVTVEARTPSLAAEIANAHVGVAIAYYGELRAKSTNAEKSLFAEQLRVAEKEFQAAEKALVDFRTQNGIYSLESQMATQQRLLEELQLERDQSVLEKATMVITTPVTTSIAITTPVIGTPVTTTAVITVPATTTMVIATPVIDPVGEVDKLIAQRQKELDQFTALAPQYNILVQNVEQARTAYQHLLGKYSEAELKVTAVQAANFIQVITPANMPPAPESSWPKLAVLALAGSLGRGVVLAFLLHYISGFKAVGVTVPASAQKASARSRAGQAVSRIFHRLAAVITRRHRTSMQVERAPQSSTGEQGPMDVQGPPVSTGTKVA